MKTVKLTPKASQDMESVWYYSYRHFGEEQADRYINQISNIFQALSENNIGTHRPELGEYISALPVERHMIYFLKTDNDIIVIRVLNQHQDAGPSSQLELTRDNHIVLRENWQGYRGVPGQNSPERVSLLPLAPGVDFATAVALRRMATSAAPLQLTCRHLK